MSTQNSAPEPLTREQFEALPIVDQRKVLARDIVAGIDAGRLRGNVTTRLFSTLARGAFLGDGYRSAEHAVVSVKRCWVCGVGAPMVVAARRVDALSEHMEHPTELNACIGAARDYLAPWFPDDMLQLLEAAYEKQAPFGFDRDAAMDARLEHFRSLHPYGTPRLRAIWQQVADDPEGMFRLDSDA